MQETKVAIVSYSRTPFCRARNGGYAQKQPDAMLIPALKNAIARANIDPSLIECVVVGNVLNSGDAVFQARLAALECGIPLKIPVIVVNRQCASGIDAINEVATQIKMGRIKIGVAIGFEKMSRDEMKKSEFTTEGSNQNSLNMGMGETAERLATTFGIKRRECDLYAAESFRKAGEAVENGVFETEIFSGGEKDEGIRKTDLERLERLKPVFAENGVCTAGNSSQMSDAAAAVVVANHEVALLSQLPVLGFFMDMVVVGLDPSLMGAGPVYAINELFIKTGLKNQNIDLYEINEAFASQIVYCIDELGIEKEKVNVYGGAIAIGHPLGATGVRLVGTLLNALKRKKLKTGIVSLCVGGGMGVAVLIMRSN